MELFLYDTQVRAEGYPVLCGVDEAGRGPLVGRKRGMLVSGGEVNTERAAITVMDEFRSGKIGRITLERPRSATAKDNAEVEL